MGSEELAEDCITPSCIKSLSHWSLKPVLVGARNRRRRAFVADQANHTAFAGALTVQFPGELRSTKAQFAERQ